MNVDLEILLGQDERLFKESVNKIVDEFIPETNNHKLLTEDVLTVKYSEKAQMLREYNYSAKLGELSKMEMNPIIANRMSMIIESETNPETDLPTVIYELNEMIRTAKDDINSPYYADIVAGYTKLAEAYVLLEAPEFLVDPDTGKREEIRNEKGQSFKKGEFKDHNGLAYTKGGKQWVTSHDSKTGTNYATNTKTLAKVRVEFEEARPERTFFRNTNAEKKKEEEERKKLIPSWFQKKEGK